MRKKLSRWPAEARLALVLAASRVRLLRSRSSSDYGLPDEAQTFHVFYLTCREALPIVKMDPFRAIGSLAAGTHIPLVIRQLVQSIIWIGR